jgi:DNA (cytosine-5)-methyltransferase 1
MRKKVPISMAFGFYEFFAGGGMARLGLGSEWHCLFANDNNEKKSKIYQTNFNGAPELHVGDINTVTVDHLPAHAMLAWASFPCQDLSLAGNGIGLSGERSGVFWPFWRLMEEISTVSRKPPIIVLENVIGLVTSHKGEDLQTILASLTRSKYRIGAVVIDAIHFLPQSRPRLFIIAVDDRIEIPQSLIMEHADPFWHPPALKAFAHNLPEELRKRWIWWNIPHPDECRLHLKDLVENIPTGVKWNSKVATDKIISMMSPINAKKVQEAQRARRITVGTIYKRMRKTDDGKKVQRAEARFDGISGCLRTPTGGSSRQTIIIVQGENVRTRLISPREAARLMGIPESYTLPDRYNDTYHLLGDGLAVPVVSWLERNLLFPLAICIASSHNVNAKQLIAIDLENSKYLDL